MPKYIIPIEAYPDHSRSIFLGDQSYEFHFRYIQEYDIWRFSLGEHLKNQLLSGASDDLLSSYRSHPVPKGRLYLNWHNTTPRDPGFADIQTGACELIYEG